jgi:hypothetical protein
MNCHECKKENLKSNIKLGVSRATLLSWTPGFYNEEGLFIKNKNPNVYYQEYICSHGHVFEEGRDSNGKLLISYYK